MRRRPRARRAACRGRAAPRARSSRHPLSRLPQRQLFCPIQSDRSVGGGDDEPAAGEMGAHELGEHCLRRRVEGRGRFIKQPDRPLDHDQPRKREAPPLSGGEIDRGQLGKPVEAHGGEGDVPLSRAAAEETRPEIEVFPYRERRLQCVLMAEIVRLLADGELQITAVELEPSLLRPHQARDQAKQRGFAHAIGAGHQQGLARANGKAQAAEDLAAPPDAGKVGPDEPHHLPTPGALGCRRNPAAGRAALAAGWVPTGSGKIPDSMPMSLASVDFLERRKKRPYKPSSRAHYQPAQDSRPVTGEAFPVASYRRAAPLPVGWEPTTMTSLDSFRCCKPLKVGSKTYAYYSLPAAEQHGLRGISRLPFSMKVLLENLLRNEDGRSITKEDIQAVAQWLKTKTSEREIAFRPARVLMQDFTGVPAVVDLAAMRDAMHNLGGDPKRINPLVPVDLVIDHSVIVNFFGNNTAFKKNVDEEYKQNQERYRFLKWAQRSFENFRVVPPGTGICHQVNLEYLSHVVWTGKEQVKVDGRTVLADVAYPDTVVGTDSHTTMVNGLSVLGWGVGGIEAEASMLGQPMSMVLPEVIGVRLTGKLKEGVTATDLVLTVTQMLRRRGVVNKFVEFCGPGLDNLSIEDRATIGNMSPEYGATCGYFPTDDDTIRYLDNTGRPAASVALVKAYAKAQGLYRTKGTPDPIFTDLLKLDLNSVEPSLAGPKRPQDRVLVKEAKTAFIESLNKEFGKGAEVSKRVPVAGRPHDLGHGDAVIAAITSCTNTSNPSVMVAAGLLARKAAAKGLKVKPWVKTSLAPGSQVVAEYLAKSGLQD